MQSKEQVILGALLVNPDILNHLKVPQNFFSKRDDQKIFNEIKKVTKKNKLNGGFDGKSNLEKRRHFKSCP